MIFKINLRKLPNQYGEVSVMKIEIKIKEVFFFFNFIFVFPSDSCQYSTGVKLCFSTAARLIKLHQVTAPGEILPF